MVLDVRVCSCPYAGLLEDLGADVEAIVAQGGHENKENAQGAQYRPDDWTLHGDDSMGARQQFGAHARKAKIVEDCIQTQDVD